jgi:hypothetical protein
MKKQIVTLAAVTTMLLLGSGSKASAGLQMKLTDNLGNTVTVTDNGLGDGDTNVGSINFVGAVGPNWNINVVGGTSKPFTGSASAPELDITTLDFSTGAGTLDIQLSDTDFTTASPVNFLASVGGTTSGSVTFNTWVDPGNVALAETTPLTSQGPFSTSPFSGNQSNVVTSLGGSPYALTLDATITHAAAGNSSFDANLSGISPPTANCATITAVTGVAITPVTLVGSGGCGGPYTFSATGLPKGLIMSTNGTISGTPNVSGSTTPFNYTVTVTDSCGNTGTFNCSITVNAVQPCKASVCGTLFVDCNGDGFLTPGFDFGVTNVPVYLQNSNKVTVATNITDSQGNYCFYNLAAGTYTVCILHPTNCIQTSGTHVNHWLNNNYQQCWIENDGYQHCKGVDGVDCWTASDGCQHWKNSNNQDCWKDKYGYSHTQQCTYVSCDVPKGDCETFTLACGQALTGVNFAYQGTLPKCVVSVAGPSKGVCGQTGSYTCTVKNTGTACFAACQVSVCGKTYSCPALSSGQSCSFSFNYQFQWSDYGNFNCQAAASCTSAYSNSNTSSSCTAKGNCYTSVGW